MRDLLRQQLARRLKRLHDRASILQAQILLVERLLADAEQGAFQPSLKLRKNSIRKLNVQANVQKFLKKADASVRAQNLYSLLLRTDPFLKPSTFRSYLKRMVDAGLIKQEGARGNYRLAESAERLGMKKRDRCADVRTARAESRRLKTQTDDTDGRHTDRSLRKAAKRARDEGRPDAV